MSVIFYLLNKKGHEVLKAVIKNPHSHNSIKLVVGARDKGNSEDYYDEILDLCRKNGIPHSNKNSNFNKDGDYSIAIGWRWIINDVKNLIILHDSYLPKYRGFSPVVNMLIKGENYLGASSIWASDSMDEGEIIVQKKVEISYPIKIQQAITLLAELYVDIVLELMSKIIKAENLNSNPQDNTDATYSIWRDDLDYFIDWKQDAAKVLRFIDAVGYPYDGAKARTVDGDIIRILEGELIENINMEINAPGKIIMNRNAPIVLCGNHAVKLLKIENINNKPFEFSKFRTRLV